MTELGNNKMIVFIGKDKANGEKIRAGERLRHKAMINTLKKNNLVCFAGPFISDMGKISGSLVIFKTRDMVLVREIMSLDPYVRSGLFSAREISPLTTYPG
jgi:uncharacterized protein